MNRYLAWILLLLTIAISAGQADAKSVNEEYTDAPETAQARHESRPTTTIETPNLYVSAQRQSSNNSFGGPSVIEVVVSDPYIAQIYIDQLEPNVTVNGAQLRMAQARDGDWYAYVVESDMAAAVNTGVAFGSECGRSHLEGFFAAKQAYCNIGILGGEIDYYHTYIDAVREPKTLGPLDADTGALSSIYGGQIGIPHTFWPVIQAFDFEDGQTVSITYYERAGPQEILLTYTESMDRYASSYVDRRSQSYLPGQQVHMTIEDMLLNIDPTDEDTWTFSTHPNSSDTGLYFQLYDEYGSRPGLYCPFAELCRMERADLGFGQAGSLTIYLEEEPNMLLVDNGQQSLNGAQRLSEYGNILQPVTFVETGPNTGIFTNTDSNGASSLVAANTAVSQTTVWEYAGQTNQIRFNRVPELDPVGNKTVVAQSELSFVVSATDPDGNQLMYSMLGQPAGATINATSGRFVWTPAVSDFGVHTITIIASDGIARSAEIIAVNVTLPAGANHPPDAPDITVEAYPGTTLAIRPQVSDPEGDGTAITNATGAAKGQIGTGRLVEGVILYTPDGGTGGTDTITYTVTDARGAASTGTITVIISRNAPPTAQDFGIRAFAGIPVTVDLGASSLIYDGESNASLAVSLARAPAQGSALFSGTTVTYTANAGASGTDKFYYTVTDAAGLADTGTVMVTIYESRHIDTLIADSTRSLAVRAGETAAFAVAADGAGSYRYVLAGAPAGAAIDLMGNFTWTPAASQTGTYNFTVIMYSDAGDFDSQHVTIAVLGQDNTPPQSRHIEMFAEAGATATDDIADIIHDAEDDVITVSIARQPAQGNATATGSVLAYAAGPAAAGTDSFEYRLTDEHGASSVWTVTVRIGSVPEDTPNRNPTAQDLFITVAQGRPTTITPEIDDPDGNHVFIRSAAGATKGSTAVSGDSITYTPHAGQTGIDIITYTVSDGRGGTGTGMITIRIDGPNNDPVLDYIGSIVTHVGDEVVFAASADDRDDDVLVFGLSGQPAGATINATSGRFAWVPAASQQGQNTFAVTVSDGRGGADSQNVAVFVHAQNTPPEGRDIRLFVDAGDAVSDDIADILHDAESDAITVAIAKKPVQGAVTVNGTVLTYAAGRSAVGFDHFEYRLTDEHGASSVWTVTMLLTIPSGGSVNHPPTAPDVQVQARRDTTALVRLEPVDPDGDTVTITSAAGATKGTLDTGAIQTGMMIYRPLAGQTGIDTMYYEVTDSYGAVANGTITVYINEPGNSRPIFGDISSAGTNVGKRLDFTAPAVDVEGHDLTFGLANAPEGAMISSEGNFSWTPDDSHIGKNTVTVTVHDGHGGGRWQDVDIFVSLAGTVNTDPVAEDIAATVVLGGAKTIPLEFSDTDGDDAVITSISPSSLGVVLDSYRSAGFIIYIGTGLGYEEITYAVSDGRGGTGTATIRVTVVAPANLSPILGLIGDRSINALRTLTFDADATDIDSTMLTFDLIGEPAGAQITPQGVFSWTPAEAQVGRHSFTVIVSDDAGGNDTEVITVNVRDKDFVNTAPVAPDIVDSTAQGTPGIVRPPISDPDDDPVRITATTGSTKGEIVTGFLRAGIVIYRPDPGQTGIDTVTYTVSDGSDQTATGTITIFINADGNRNPVLAPIGFRNINAGERLTFDIMTRDSDQVSYLLAGAPAGATVSEQGAFSWTPAASDLGNHTFTIAIYDDRGGSSSEIVTVRVLPAGTANGAPNAPPVSITVNTGSSTMITPEIDDPDGDPVRITGATGDAAGTIILSADGILYIAGPTTGTETVTYTVTDARGATSTGTITIILQ